jgi:hypothetical protein
MIKLTTEELVEGKLVTLSNSKSTGDCSYSYTVWEVKYKNDFHIVIVAHDDKEDWYFKGPHVINLSEHDFFDAKDIADLG